MKPRLLSAARLSFPLATAIAALLASPCAHAINYYWDVDGTTAGTVGTTATWGTLGTTWSTSSTGVLATSAYTTLAADDLFFSAGTNNTGAYAITLTTTQNASSLTFEEGTATISGASGLITLGGTGGKITALSGASATIGNNTNTIIGGTVGLTKQGAGTLTLNGTLTNTFTGGLNVNGGTLALDFANIAASTNLVTSQALSFGGGNLTLKGKTGSNATTQTLGNVTVNAGGGSLLIDPNTGTSTTLTLGSLTSTAAGGSLTLGKAVTANTGTVTITTTTNKDATGIYGGRIIFANGTANTGYDWATTASSVTPYTLSAYSGYATNLGTTLTAATDTVNSRIQDSGTAAITHALASGTLTTNSLKIENTATAAAQAVTLGTGTMVVTSGGLLSTGTRAYTISGGGTVGLTAGNGSGAYDLIVHQYNSGGLTISAVIGNNGANATALTKAGTGNLTLSAANTYTGATNVNAGTLTVSSTGSIAAGSAINVAAGATITTSRYNGYGGAGPGNAAWTIAGTMTVTGGASAEALPTSVTLNNGTMNGAAFSTFGTYFNNSGVTATITANGSGNTISGGNIGMAATSTLAFSTPLASDAITVSSALGGTSASGGAMSKTGAGTLTLSGTNIYTGGTTISNGTLKVGSATALGASTGAVSVASGAVLDLNGTTMTNTNALTISGTGISSGGALTNSSGTAGTYAGLVSLGATGTSIVASSGNIILSNPATIVGTSTGFGLILDGAATGSSIASIINGGITGTAGAGTLTKQGSGTWTLSGANSYTGATTISAGTLKLGATGDATNTPLGTIATGTTVSGTGTLDLAGFTLGTAEALTLSGTGTSNSGALANSAAGAATYSGLITLGATGTSIVAGGGTGANIILSNAGTIFGTTTGFGLVLDGTATGSSIASIINGGISGTAGAGTLTKQGAGTWTLSGANTYTGGTTINGGTLQLSGSGTFGATSGTLSFTGTGTANLGGTSQTLGNLGTLPVGTVTGTLTNGSLALTGASDLVLTPTLLTAGTFITDATGLSALTITKTSNTLTVAGASNSTAAQSSTFKLSPTSNTIKVSALNIGTGNGSSTGSIVNNGVMTLGTTNIFEVDTVQIGTLRSTADLSFQSGLTNPTVSFRGAGGGTNRVTSFLVGVNAAGTSAGNVQTANFSAGSIDGRFTTITVGQGASSSGNVPSVLGVFTMNAGTVDSTNIVLADDTSGGGNTPNSGTFTQNAGTVIVGTLTLGQRVGTSTAPILTPTYNLGTASLSATLKAQSIVAGTGTVDATSVRNINWTNGTIQNYDASTDLSINGTGTAASTRLNLVLTGGTTHTFFADSARTITVGANTVISGTALTKDGAGTLVLSGANSYTGGTTISAGTLKIGNATALGGNAGAASVTSGAALDLNGTTMTGTNALQISGTGVSSGGALTNSSATAGTYAGLIKLGATGTSIVSSSGNIIISNAGTIVGTSTDFGLILDGTATGSSIASIINGGITGTAGAGTLTKQGNGTWTLSGANTYTGLTTVSNGTLSITTTGALPGFSTNGRYSVANGATLAVYNAVTNADITSMLGTTNFAAGSALGFDTTTASRTYSVVLANTAQGALGLTKLGANSLTIDQANTFTGATTISAGTLVLSNVNALGGNSPGVNGTSGITMVGGTTLAPTLTGVVINAPITVGATATTVTISAPNVGSQTFTDGVLTLGGAITGAGNVTFNSTQNANNLNNILLTAQSNYAGSTLINTTSSNSGTSNAHQIVVRLGINDALPTTTVLTIDGGTGAGSGRVAEFVMNGYDQTLAGLNNVTRNLRVQRVVNSDVSAASTLTINGSVNSTYGGVIGVNSAANSMVASNFPGGTNGNNILLTKDGSGTFTLTGANTFSGRTLISGGILSLGNASALSQSALDTTNSIPGDLTNGLRSTVTTLTLGGLTGSNSFASRFTTTTGGYTGLTALTLNPVAGASHSYSADIGNGNGSMSLTKSGLGTQTLAVAQTYSGGTFVSAGNLALSGTATLGVSGTALTLSGGSLDLGTLSQTVGAVSITAAAATGDTISNGSLTGTSYAASNTTGTATISANLLFNGGAGFAKTGAGAAILSGTNTYTGGSTVTGGALVFRNTDAKEATGTHTFDAGTTLGLGVATSGAFFTSADVDNAFAGNMVGNLSNVTVTATTNVGIDTTQGDLSYTVIGTPSKGLSKFGANTLTLTGDYTGPTTVDAGTLIVNNISSSSSLSLSSGMTLALRNDLNTSFGPATIATPAAGVTYNFDVNQATGAGTGRTLTLGNITFATSTANTINVTGGNGYTLGLGTLSVPSGSGGPWAFTVNATTAAVTIAKFSTGSFGSALALQGGNAITLSNFEMGANGSNSITVSGSGTVANLGTTTGTNNRGGGSATFTLADGTMNLTTTTSIANTRQGSGINTVTVVAPTFNINGGTLNNTSGGSLTLGGLISTSQNNNANITINGDFAFGTAGSTSLNNLDLGTGTVSLGTTAGTTRQVTVNGATNLTLGGIISNGTTANSLTKAGTGTLALSGANTYTGTTTISAGALVMGDAAADTFTTSGVTVASNATLAGAGDISGTLDITGILAPGATTGSIGTLKAGATTWQGGTGAAATIWQFDLSAASNDSDALAITGNFTKGAGSGSTYRFDFMNSAPTTWGNVYTLVTWTGTTDFLLGDFSYTNLGGAYDGMAGTGFTISGNSLTFTAVPEPTSALAGLLVAAGLLRRRRA